MDKPVTRKFRIRVEQTEGIGEWRWNVYVYRFRKGCIYETHSMTLPDALRDAGNYIYSYQDTQASR